MAQKNFKVSGIDTANVVLRANGYNTTLTANADLNSNVSFALPVEDGTNGQALTTDGGGGLSFSSFVSSVSGTTNEIDVSGSTSVTLSLPDSLIAPGDLTVTGNLTVSGNTTYVNTETLEVEDNIITLNSSLGSGVTPTEDAGLEVNRGAQANVQFRWNETIENWEYGEVDGTFTRVDQSQSTIVLARNESGSLIGKGVPVYIAGYSAGGSRPTIAPADADVAATMPAFGITLTSASHNSNQRVVVYGTITQLNTNAFSAGDNLWVSETVGTLQNTRPTGASTEIQQIAKVLRKSTTDGSIVVMGASRTNAIPNLPTNNVFIGDGGATHTTINLNATIQTQSAANDYNTYTTLVSLIDTVQDNVTTSDNNVWVNANDYNTYTTLVSLVDTVQDNVTTSDNNVWVNANDYTTYSTLSGLVDTVQDNVSTNATSINTVQDNVSTNTTSINTVQSNLTTTTTSLNSFGTYANSNFLTGTGGESSNFDDVTINGDLIIRGNTTTIEATNTVLTDPLLLLNNGVTGTNTVDIGIIFNRGSLSNAAFMYDESEDMFQFGFTQQGGDASDLIYSSHAMIRADSIRAGNVELGWGAERNEITVVSTDAKDLKLSGNTQSPDSNIVFSSNIVPSANGVYSIGAPDALVKDIHVSDGTIFIGVQSQISANAITLSNFNVDADGSIRIPGVNIAADADAVETVTITASDIPSNAAIQAQILETVGQLSDLATTAKNNVVVALNEVRTSINTVNSNAAVSIDDLSDVDTSTNSPSNGEVLTWIAANSAFEPKSVTTDAISDDFTISTANTFTLSSSVSEANNILVSVSGISQIPTDDYVVSGTTLTLNNTVPLPVGAKVEVRHLSRIIGAGNSIGSIVEDTTPQLGGDLDLNSSDITGTGNIYITGYIRTVPTTVSGLPAAGTAGAGARAFVTDATSTTFASTVSGGGGNSVPVYSDGTNWKIG